MHDVECMFCRSMPGLNYSWAHYLPVHRSHWGLPAWAAPKEFGWSWDWEASQNYKRMCVM